MILAYIMEQQQQQVAYKDGRRFFIIPNWFRSDLMTMNLIHFSSFPDYLANNIYFPFSCLLDLVVFFPPPRKTLNVRRIFYDNNFRSLALRLSFLNDARNKEKNEHMKIASPTLSLEYAMFTTAHTIGGSRFLSSRIGQMVWRQNGKKERFQ